MPVRPIRLAARAVAIGGLAAVSLFALARVPSATAEETARLVPPPAQDEQPGAATREVAVFAGGCFWGVQGVFQHVRGVDAAVSGYTGGSAATAEYPLVSTGATGHAESVQVTFDPHKVTYGALLQVFFSVAHDPTERDRQGPDVGTQYRSALFPTSPEQAAIAAAYIAQLDAAHAWPAPVMTRIEPGKMFHPAEAYHQDYLTRHPDNPYIAINDLPKLDALRRLLPAEYVAQPVLVGDRGTELSRN